MNLIILGPQGSGKGTQAKLLAEKYNLTHISSGALLRAEAESGSPKGKIIAKILQSGELMPFETVLDVLEPALRNSRTGFIIDGTPREISQAEYLDYFLKELKTNIDKVILLDIPREVSLERLAKRAVLEGRTDDTPEAIKERLDTYTQKTIPIIEHYRSQGKLLEIDGRPDIDTIFQEICTRLNSGVK